MSPRLRLILSSLLLALAVAPLTLLANHRRALYAGLTAHEWGTFTSVAGSDGQAVEWLPLTGSTDLPSFVEHLREGAYKLGLRGTVRMETPVLYFYSPVEQTVSVQVRFSQGLITEWYPHASQVEPHVPLYDGVLYQKGPGGSIAWDAVTLSPSLRASFPQESGSDRYYAARATVSTPLRVQTPFGEQHEKFLFYRGVATFPVPISATIAVDAVVHIENRGAHAMPATILFERRGEKVGYRLGGTLQDQMSLEPPDLSGSIDSLAHDLEGILVNEGLYQNEAQAMVQTWRDSWFEEGSRLLYIVPREFVDSVLPLSIKPAPMQTTRVFVGRLELVTPATRNEVEQAVASHDDVTLAKYGRFLEPILKTVIASATNTDKARQLCKTLNAYYHAQMQKNFAAPTR
jgi:hypothetical protein